MKETVKGKRKHGKINEWKYINDIFDDFEKKVDRISEIIIIGEYDGVRRIKMQKYLYNPYTRTHYELKEVANGINKIKRVKNK